MDLKRASLLNLALPGKVLVGKITAGEHVHNGRLILLVHHVGDSGRGLELEVCDEVVAQYLGLLLYFYEV